MSTDGILDHMLSLQLKCHCASAVQLQQCSCINISVLSCIHSAVCVGTHSEEQELACSGSMGGSRSGGYSGGSLGGGGMGGSIAGSRGYSGTGQHRHSTLICLCHVIMCCISSTQQHLRLYKAVFIMYSNLAC